MGYYRQINAANLPDGVGKMKQFACWFTHGVGNGSELRRIVHSARTPQEVVENVERFFADKIADRGTPAHEPSTRGWNPEGARRKDCGPPAIARARPRRARIFLRRRNRQRKL